MNDKEMPAEGESAAVCAPDAQYMRCSKIFKGAALISIAFAAAASIFITLGFLKQYDNGVDHFARGSYFLALTVICALLSLAAAVTGALMLRGKCSPALPLSGSTPAIFGSSLCAFMLVASAALDFISYAGAPLEALRVASSVTAVLAAAYFFLAAVPINKASPLFGLAGLAPAAWAILTLMVVYFSRDLALNSPHKVCLQLMYVSLMVYFVTECRFALGRITAPRWLFAGCAAILATALVWVPRMVWAVRGETLYDYTLISTAVFASASAYVAIRLFTSSKMCAFRPQPKPEKKKTLANDAKTA